MLLNRMKKIFLVLGDLIVLFSSLFLTLLIRYRGNLTERTWDQHLAPFAVLFAIWLLVFFINGLYEISASKNDFEFYNKILQNLLLNYGLAAVYFYLFAGKFFHIKPQTVFFIFMAVVSALFILWRYWYNSIVQSPYFAKNVMVVGMNDEARELVEEIAKKPQLGYRITSVVHDGWHRQAPDLPDITAYKSDSDLKKIIREKKITTVVTVLDPHQSPELVQNLYECLTLRLQFFDLPTFYEKLTGKIPVTNIGHIWFLENLAEGEKSIYEIVKRLFDIVVSSLVLVASSPLFPVFALLIKFDSKGPIFFRQTRIGFLGRSFQVIKFRSMFADSEKEGPKWTQRNDTRVTRVGRLMRKLRADELPQLLNIIWGEMSLVGPRPEQPEFVKNLQKILPFYNERHLVRPGLTGWAQINFQYGASAGDALKKLQYDLFYIKNRSLPLDAGIILKTFNIILRGLGL